MNERKTYFSHREVGFSFIARCLDDPVHVIRDEAMKHLFMVYITGVKMKLQKIFFWFGRGESSHHYWHGYGGVGNHLSSLFIILVAAEILFHSPTLAQGSADGLEGFKFGVGLTLTIDAGGLNINVNEGRA